MESLRTLLLALVIVIGFTGCENDLDGDISELNEIEIYKTDKEDSTNSGGDPVDSDNEEN